MLTLGGVTLGPMQYCYGRRGADRGTVIFQEPAVDTTPAPRGRTADDTQKRTPYKFDANM